MGQVQRIVKNSFVTGVGGIIAAGLNFLTIMIIARHLGISRFGYYAFVMAFVGIFQLVADLGVRNILIRDVSVDKKRLERSLGITKFLIWILSVIAFLAIAVIINIIGQTQEVILSVYIAGIAVITTFHAVGYGAVCRAFEDMELNAIGNVLHKGMFLLLISVGVRLGVGLRGLFTCLLISNISLWAYYYMIVRKKYIRPRLYIDINASWSTLKEAFPLGIAGIFRKATWQVDTLILTGMTDVATVGLFSSAYKIIQAINLLPLTLALPLFPAFSRLANISEKRLFASFEKSLRFLWTFSLPITVVITLLSDKIILRIFGKEFIDASSSLQILSWALIFLFSTSLYLYLFTAMGKQMMYTISSGICLVINIILDILFIPIYGYIGASIATLASEMILFGTGFFFLMRMGCRISILNIAWRPVCGSIVMGAIIYQVRDLPLLWLSSGIGLGLLLYGTIILLSKGLSQEEIASIIGDRYFKLIKVPKS
ncbi:MAG: flippase [Nitrospirota bacterium]